MNIEYTVVQNSYHDNFVKEVNEKLNEGWDLQGNLQSNKTSHGTVWFAQAMIRTIDDEPKDKEK